MSDISIQQLFIYTNQARTNPKKFSEYIKQEMADFIDNKTLPLKKGLNRGTSEGKASWIQAIQFCQKQQPLTPLRLDDKLNMAAKNHCIDMQKNKFFEHQSSNGTSFGDRVGKIIGKIPGSMGQNLGVDFDVPQRNHALKTILGLIIDDGVSSRGHRKNIFNDKFNFVGIYAVKIPGKIYTCMDFHSANPSEKEKSVQIKQTRKHTQISTKFQLEKKQKPSISKVEVRKPSSQASAISMEQVLKYTNEARTNPKKFIQHIKQQMGLFIDQKALPFKKGVNIGTFQGKAAWIQAIQFCKKQKPLNSLKIDHKLFQAAKKHAIDMEKNNFFEHQSSDGTSFGDRVGKIIGKIPGSMGQILGIDHDIPERNHALKTVMGLIIDDGVKVEGINFNFVGIYSSFVKGKIYTCMDFHTADPSKKQQQMKQPKLTVQNFEKIHSQKTDQKTLLKYTNQARTDPKKFSLYINQQLNEFIDQKTLPLKKGMNKGTFEGKASWIQGLKFCQKQKPLPALEIDNKLNLAAKNHGIDMQKNNFFEHQSSNGTQFANRLKKIIGSIPGSIGQNLGIDYDVPGRNNALQTVMGLIIDDGVPSRGHRQNIFSQNFKYVGIYSVLVKDKIYTCMDFHSANPSKVQTTKLNSQNIYQKQIKSITLGGISKKNLINNGLSSLQKLQNYRKTQFGKQAGDASIKSNKSKYEKTQNPESTKKQIQLPKISIKKPLTKNQVIKSQLKTIFYQPQLLIISYFTKLFFKASIQYIFSLKIYFQFIQQIH